MGPPCQSNTPKEVNLAVQWDVNNVEGTYPSYQKMNKIIIFFMGRWVFAKDDNPPLIWNWVELIQNLFYDIHSNSSIQVNI